MFKYEFKNNPGVFGYEVNEVRRKLSDLTVERDQYKESYEKATDKASRLLDSLKSVNNRLVFAFPLVNPEQDIDDPIEAYRIVISRVNGAIEELNKAISDAADMVGAV